MTPALDALLKDVEALSAKMRDGSMGDAVDALLHTPPSGGGA